MTTKTITLKHIRKAAHWAKAALSKKKDKPCLIKDSTRMFDLSQYDCGTACCIAGAAAIEAGFSHRRIYRTAYNINTTIAGEAGRKLHNLIADKTEDIDITLYEDIGDDQVKLKSFYNMVYALEELNSIMSNELPDYKDAPDMVLECLDILESECKELGIPIPEFVVTAEM